VTPLADRGRLVIRSQRVLTPAGLRPASVHIASGRIESVASWDEVPSDGELIDVGTDVVMPGVIDTHVHVNEPGRTEWEGFRSATHAAAAGGVTTILDMPLNSIPATTTVSALETKRASAGDQSVVNVEYIGGLVPGNLRALDGLADAGVRAFKCFLTPSGVDEFANVSEHELTAAFPTLRRLGLPLMVHAEDPREIREGPVGGSRSYADYLASRPVSAERSAISLLIQLMQEVPARVHIVHLSSAESLRLVDDARVRGLPITVETCPHYLSFAEEEIPDGATEYKCAPPIRDAEERDALWAALIDGTIDSIASDHSPCPPQMKEAGGDFFAAWGGIASLQVSLPAVWTGARARGVTLGQLAEWMCVATGRLAGLSDRKGRIASGYDADIVVWNPDLSFVVDPAKLLHRHTVTPYAGRTLYGVVRATYVGGHQVFGEHLSRPDHE
jgi:allantoinase